MIKIIGYGEDSLTYWAFTHKPKEILGKDKLDDYSDPQNCVVFYRPSFGRGGRGTSNFGEFDAILATNKAIYLVESKWDKSSEWKKSLREIRLDKSQIRRHKIFNWYFNLWNQKKDPEEIFHNEELKSEFSSKFKKYTKSGEVEMTIPKPGTALAKQIIFIMNKLGSNQKRNVKNVVLFFYSNKTEEYLKDKNNGQSIELKQAEKNDNDEFEKIRDFEDVIPIKYDNNEKNDNNEKYNSLGFVNMSNKSNN